jgi:hypothetical protein
LADATLPEEERLMIEEAMNNKIAKLTYEEKVELQRQLDEIRGERLPDNIINLNKKA